MVARYASIAAALAAGATALSGPRDESSSGSTPGVLALPVYQHIRLHPLEKLRRRAVSDTDVPVINVTSTTYLIERRWNRTIVRIVASN